MKKTAILCALVSILFCYMEWGGGNSAFVYETEYLILFGKAHRADTLTHPVVLVPLIGQVLLLVALFQRQPSRRLVIAGVSLLGVLGLLLLLVGVLGRSVAIAASTLPFLASAIWCLRLFRRSASGTNVPAV